MQQDRETSSRERYSSCEDAENKSDSCSIPSTVRVDKSDDGEQLLASVERDDVSAVVTAPADADRDELTDALTEVAGAVETYGWRMGGR